MFSTLYNSVFPRIGSFLGCISSIASSRTDLVLDWLFGYVDSIYYVNLFNGHTEMAFSVWFNSGVTGIFSQIFRDFLRLILTPVYGLMTSAMNLLSAASMPFWVFLLVCFTSFFLTVAFVKFIIGLIR